MTAASSPPPEPQSPKTRWAELTGGAGGEEYAARFAAVAATGKDMHGEADLCAALVVPPARVLDAGCGTGRVAIRLHALGFDCVGVDVDSSMLAVARASQPDITWVLADLSGLDLAGLALSGLARSGLDHVSPADDGAPPAFDLVVAAGNVIPLLAEGTLGDTVRALSRHLAPGGLFVAGFGLDAAHLPHGCPVTGLTPYDHACERAGLEPAARYGTWDAQEYTGGGYAVSVHRVVHRVVTTR